MRLKIKTRLLLLLGAAMTVSTVVYFSFAMWYTTRVIRQQEELEHKNLVQVIEQTIQSKLDTTEIAIMGIVGNPQIQEAFARRDREQLVHELHSTYAGISDKVIRFHFHLPDSTSFLRVHDPGRFGDDLSRIRFMVNEANHDLRTVRGLERGVDGFGLRVVVPLFFQERHIGSVEYGSEFGGGFLSELKQHRQAEYILLATSGPDNVELIAGTTPDAVCPLTGEDLERVFEGRPFPLSSCMEKEGIYIIPFRDYSDQVSGFIKVIQDRSAIAASLQSMRFNLSMIGILFVLLVSSLLYFLIEAALRPLPQIFDQTKRISTEILKGNHLYRASVEETAPDFQAVIHEINVIIKALRVSEAQKQAILDGFPGIIYHVDRKGRILWANRTVREFCPDMTGKNCFTDFSRESMIACQRQILERAVETGGFERDLVCVLEGGQTREQTCWETIAVPLRDEYESAASLIIIGWNISEKVRFENELRELNLTLESRVHEEIEKRKEQEQMLHQQSKLASIGELAAGIAHEINQPLNTISFAMENLLASFQDNSLTPEYLQRKARNIEEDIHRIRRIIDHVRTFSREQSLEFYEPFDVNDSIRGALSLIQAQYASHSIALDIQLDETTLGPVDGNLHQFEQIVLNLLSNARDAVEERFSRQPEHAMRIAVRAFRRNGQAVVEIEDNGIGIPRKLRDRVFDPFFTTKDPQRGTGLGLSISYGLVHRMHGSIELESRESGGTTIRVSVPVLGPGRGKGTGKPGPAAPPTSTP